MPSSPDMTPSTSMAEDGTVPYLPLPALWKAPSCWAFPVLATVFLVLLSRALIKTRATSVVDEKETHRANLEVPIPGPKPLPIIGNALDVDINALVGSVVSLAWRHRPLFSLSLLGTRYIVVGTPALCRELCDESRFHKFVALGLERLRPVTGDGLFTAFHGSEAWGVAHRLLLPLFGTFRIRDMFDDMRDVAEQLTLKWARLPSGSRLDLGSDFTRLTLDTVALTCLDFRFNSFYRDESLHPFVQNVDGVLAEAARRSTLPSFTRYLRFRADARFRKSTRYLFRVCQDMIDDRRRRGEDGSRRDVLSALVFGRDPKAEAEAEADEAEAETKAEAETSTRGRLSDEHIIHNMLTFLSAGHETTSAMLTTACFYLCECPEAQARAQSEVDAVVGPGALGADHLQRLPYLEAVVKEALRLVPTAPTFFVTPLADGALGGGRYRYRRGDVLAPALEVVQRDAGAYGRDAHEFRPERMLREEFARVPEHAFKPFGNGLRGCIGRTFVYQESLIILAMLLQRFDFKKDDPSYRLRLRSDLSVKPDGFYMQVRPRRGASATQSPGVSPGGGTTGGQPSSVASILASPSPRRGAVHKAARGQPVMILHGSNAGTCAAAASVLASACVAKGFAPHLVDTMDAAVARLSAESPVVMVAASYNGLPAEGAAGMMGWLEEMASRPGGRLPLRGVRYAVFGCGHSDWGDSYQRVPLLADRTMARAGATRLVPMGTSDAAAGGGGGDVFSDLARWAEEQLFPALYRACGMRAPPRRGGEDEGEGEDDGEGEGEVPGGALSISVDHPARARVRPGYFPAVVTCQRQLSKKNTTGAGRHVPVKRHIELRFEGPGPRPGFRLPETGADGEAPSYLPGDHLLVLPRNDPKDVSALLARFGLSWDAQVTIGSGRALGVDDGTRLSAAELLDAYVEIPRAVTARHLRALLAVSRAEETRSQLSTMLDQLPPPTTPLAAAGEEGGSLLSLLRRHPDLPLPFATFLRWTAPMRPRTYSISSAPSARPGHGTLTVSVVRGGLASGYLAGVREGDVVYARVHRNPVFRALLRAPPSPSPSPSPPLVMIAVGSGLAPFRAVVQDLAARRAAGAAGGRRRAANENEGGARPALLFYGCRGRHVDEMYADELDAAERAGVVVVHRAYSREEGSGGVDSGHRYVTDAVAARADAILALWRDHGALIRVCAGKKVADAVWQVLGPVLLESEESGESGESEEAASRRDHRKKLMSLPEWRRDLGLNSASRWEERYVEEVFS